MGWGCNKHEIDAGSDDWDAALERLCDRKLLEKKSFGRDGQICPLCWEEMEDEVRALRGSGSEKEFSEFHRRLFKFINAWAVCGMDGRLKLSGEITKLVMWYVRRSIARAKRGAP